MKDFLETIRIALIFAILSFGLLVILQISTQHSPNYSEIEQ